MAKFILLAADAVSSAPQVHKAGAYEWLAFGVIMSLGLFICYHLFWDHDSPQAGSEDYEDDRSDTNPDHEVWV